MTHDTSFDMEYADYMTATLLAECIAMYSDLDTLKAYDATFKNYQHDITRSAAPKIKAAPTLIALGEAFSNTETLSDKQENLLRELKAQVSALIDMGHLIPVGFKVPRGEFDKPVTIAKDVFAKGIINWDKSEAVLGEVEFSAVRLLENENVKINVNKFQRSGNVIIENKNKSNKIVFADLKPEHFLTERNAADYLKISPRALQALRKNGGGPEFTKRGQAVRYMKSDLDAWLQNK